MNLRIVSKPFATNAAEGDLVTTLDTCVYVVDDAGNEHHLDNVTRVAWEVGPQAAYTLATIELEGVQLDVTTDASTVASVLGSLTSCVDCESHREHVHLAHR